MAWRVDVRNRLCFVEQTAHACFLSTNRFPRKEIKPWWCDGWWSDGSWWCMFDGVMVDGVLVWLLCDGWWCGGCWWRTDGWCVMMWWLMVCSWQCFRNGLHIDDTELTHAFSKDQQAQTYIFILTKREVILDHLYWNIVLNTTANNRK